MNENRITLYNGGATVVNGKLVYSKEQIEYADNELRAAFPPERWQRFIEATDDFKGMVRGYVLLPDEDRAIYLKLLKKLAAKENPI